MIYYKHGTAKSQNQFLGGIMRNSWVLIDADWYGTSMWEEMSQLFWCGGDTYAIVFERAVCGAPRQETVSVYNGLQIKDAWKNEQASYDYYRNNA